MQHLQTISVTFMSIFSKQLLDPYVKNESMMSNDVCIQKVYRTSSGQFGLQSQTQ